MKYILQCGYEIRPVFNVLPEDRQMVVIPIDLWRELVAEILDHQRRAGDARKERIDKILLKVGEDNA